VALVRGLRERGHEVLMLALYTPLRSDGPDPSLNRVFYGGINSFLQQHFAVCRSTPWFVDWVFDRPGLIRAASRVAVETRPEELGEMTVAVLRGGEGKQRKELEKLVSFLERQPRSSVVNLTNSLLVGLAPRLKERLGAPVVSTLQGEDAFVARLPVPYRDEALGLLRQHARSIDLFLAPGESYADEMSRFLQVPRDRVRVVHTGIEVDRFARSSARTRQPFRVGFLSRLSPAKGLDALVEAFSILEHRRPGEAVLAVAGELHKAHREYWKELQARLQEEGLSDRLEYRGVVSFQEKVEFLQGLSVFCLPSRFPEKQAVAALEAQAAGVPIVVPASGIFPEMVGLTGGGLLVADDGAEAYADALASLQSDPERADQLGKLGAAGIARHFSAGAMVEKTLEAYRAVIVVGSQST